MHVTFDLTPDDFWHFSLYYRRNKHPIRPFFMYALFGVILFLFLAGTWIAAEYWLTYGRVQSSLLVCLPVLLFFAVLIFPPTKRRVIKVARQRPGLFCEHTIGITPEWLFEKTRINENKVAWTTLKSIEEDSEYLFLFLDKLVAHVIPKRAFSSPHEVEAFLNMTRQYWKASESGEPILAEDAAVWPPPPRIGG